jgi:superfamily II DNA or RNA helicase
MRDEANEIAMVMNLILPEDKQLPIENKFDNKFMEKEHIDGSEEEYLLVKPDKKETLKKYFKGRVSFLSNFSDLGREYVGEYRINNIPTFTLDTDFMSRFQSKYYFEALEKDSNQKTIRSNSRQSSLMVFPNGTYGTEGFKTISKKVLTKTIKKGENITTERIIYDFSSIKKYLAQDKLKNLAQLSSKYAQTIDQILNAKNRSSFVYCNLVKGSGAIVFGLLLQEFGFTQARGGEKSKSLRYAIITQKTASTVQMDQIIKRFNSPDNYQGEYIKVIIGSRVIGEGISLLNVQDIHVLTPWWNYAEISQAIARGIREGSHLELIRNGIQPQIRIFQHASIPQVKIKNKEILSPKYDKSVDIQMYSLSAAKDISIKSVERLLKESAFDCGLTYEVNYNPQAGDFSRECDYTYCDYTCDGLENYNRYPDLSTYQLYYSAPVINYLEKNLNKIFRTYFSISETEIYQEDLPEYTQYELITALRNLINHNSALKNKYGFPSYLKEKYNQYFLVNSLTAIPEKFSEYYAQKPYIRDPIPFSKLVDELQNKYLPQIINALINYVDNIEKFRELMSRIPLEIQETLIEAAILSKKQKLKKNTKFREKILSYFDHFIQDINGVWISSRLYDEFEVLRCLKNNTWSDCNEDVLKKWNEQKEEVKFSLENNPYGYYGIYDPENGKFWIRDVAEENKIESEDKRKKTTGAECSSTGWSREKLLTLINAIKLEYPKDFCENLSKKEIYDKGMRNTWARRVINQNMDKDTLCRMIYYAPFKKGTLCPILKNWFEKNSLLIIGKKDEKK